MAQKPTIKLLIGSGSLSVRIHQGTPSEPFCVGTADPSIWRHAIWFDGQVYVAELKSDLVKHVPTHAELFFHFEECKGKKNNPWMRVCA